MLDSVFHSALHFGTCVPRSRKKGLPAICEKLAASLLLLQAFYGLYTAHIAVATSDAEKIYGEAPLRNVHSWIRLPLHAHDNRIPRQGAFAICTPLYFCRKLVLQRISCSYMSTCSKQCRPSYWQHAVRTCHHKIRLLQAT